MPFDGATFNTPAILKQRLIDALRNQDWPNWNLFSHSNCAMGVAWKIGLVDFPTTDSVAAAIGISAPEARRVFIPRPGNWPLEYRRGWLFKRKVGYARVTPAMVADALERIGGAPHQ